MTNRSINTIIIFLLTLLVAGAGYYLTEVRQPQELERIEEQKKLVRLQQAEMEQLFVEEASSEAQAEETLRKWHARYKVIPASLETPDVIQYLESLSATGFEQFSVKLSSKGSTRDFSYYVFDVSGTAFYSSLYQFVWHLENNREFYQVDNLDVAHTNVFETNEETGEQRRLDMVNFSMKLKVFYAGLEGLSATGEELIEVPETLLPARQLPHDSFHPIVRTDLPPNDELLVDVEKDQLISIAGERAIFVNKHGQHVLREGDRVYLGTIVKIDPMQSMVRATLNKGGLIETVDIKMEVDKPFRQAQREDVQLAPIKEY